MSDKRAELMTLIANSKMTPAGKRKAFLKLGVQSEYQPHQGARERARRLRRLSKPQQVG